MSGKVRLMAGQITNMSDQKNAQPARKASQRVRGWEFCMVRSSSNLSTAPGQVPEDLSGGRGEEGIRL